MPSTNAKSRRQLSLAAPGGAAQLPPTITPDISVAPYIVSPGRSGSPSGQVVQVAQSALQLAGIAAQKRSEKSFREGAEASVAGLPAPSGDGLAARLGIDQTLRGWEAGQGRRDGIIHLPSNLAKATDEMVRAWENDQDADSVGPSMEEYLETASEFARTIFDGSPHKDSDDYRKAYWQSASEVISREAGRFHQAIQEGTDRRNARRIKDEASFGIRNVFANHGLLKSIESTDPSERYNFIRQLSTDPEARAKLGKDIRAFASTFQADWIAAVPGKVNRNDLSTALARELITLAKRTGAHEVLDALYEPDASGHAMVSNADIRTAADEARQVIADGRYDYLQALRAEKQREVDAQGTAFVNATAGLHVKLLADLQEARQDAATFPEKVRQLKAQYTEQLFTRYEEARRLTQLGGDSVDVSNDLKTALGFLESLSRVVNNPISNPESDAAVSNLLNPADIAAKPDFAAINQFLATASEDTRAKARAAFRASEREAFQDDALREAKTAKSLAKQGEAFQRNLLQRMSVISQRMEAADKADDHASYQALAKEARQLLQDSRDQVLDLSTNPTSVFYQDVPTLSSTLNMLKQEIDNLDSRPGDIDPVLEDAAIRMMAGDDIPEGWIEENGFFVRPEYRRKLIEVQAGRRAGLKHDREKTFWAALENRVSLLAKTSGYIQLPNGKRVKPPASDFLEGSDGPAVDQTLADRYMSLFNSKLRAWQKANPEETPDSEILEGFQQEVEEKLGTSQVWIDDRATSFVASSTGGDVHRTIRTESGAFTPEFSEDMRAIYNALKDGTAGDNAAAYVAIYKEGLARALGGPEPTEPAGKAAWEKRERDFLRQIGVSLPPEQTPEEWETVEDPEYQRTVESTLTEIASGERRSSIGFDATGDDKSSAMSKLKSVFVKDHDKDRLERNELAPIFSELYSRNKPRFDESGRFFDPSVSAFSSTITSIEKRFGKLREGVGMARLLEDQIEGYRRYGKRERVPEYVEFAEKMQNLLNIWLRQNQPTK